MKRAYVDIPEGQMHYRYAGKGEPVIMLHMSGSSSDEFEEVGNILSESFAVYAIDFLAFGGSDRPPKQYTLPEHTQTVISFMDALGLKSVYLIGNLVGSNIALQMALQCPERIKGMMLSMICYDPDHEKFKSAGTLPVFQPIKTADDGSHIMEMWKRTARYQESAAITDARTLCLHIAGEWGESLHWALFNSEDLTLRFPEIAAPVLFFTSPADNDVKVAQIISELVPKAKHMTIEGLVPLFIRKHPETVAKLFLSDFMEFVSK